MENVIMDDRKIGVWESAARDAAQHVIPAMRQSLGSDAAILARFVVDYADTVTEAWAERCKKFEGEK